MQRTRPAEPGPRHGNGDVMHLTGEQTRLLVSLGREQILIEMF